MTTLLVSGLIGLRINGCVEGGVALGDGGRHIKRDPAHVVDERFRPCVEVMVGCLVRYDFNAVFQEAAAPSALAR